MATVLNQNNQDKDQKPTDPTQPSTTMSQPGSVVAASNTPSQPQKQGSGMFTNIQKYINANKTSGQNLVNNVSQNVQKGMQGQESKVNDANAQIKAGIEQGKQGINQGTQYGQQLNQIGQNIQNQTSTDTNKNYNNRDVNALGIDNFDNTGYQKFQQGQLVNEGSLGIQNQNLVNQGQNLQNLANQNLQNISTDSGRFNMIRNMFGKNNNPNYTSGQQRLDTMFLSQNPLTGLRGQIQANAKNAQQALNSAQQYGQNVNQLTQTEKDLINQNQGTASKNTDQYLNMLNSYVGELNQNRAQDWQNLQGQLDSLKPKDMHTFLEKATPASATPTHQMDTATLAKLGLGAGNYQTYNVFNNLKNQDIANRGRDAANAQDVATQTDVDKFAALSKIANADPSRLNQASQLGDSWLTKTGADSLTGRLNTAKDLFNNYANNTTIGAHAGGGDNWSEIRGTSLKNVLGGGSMLGGDRRMAGTNVQQGRDMYQDVLNKLQQQGAGNYLNVGKDNNAVNTGNALTGITPNMTEEGNKFGYSSGHARLFNSDLINQFKNNLQNAGVDTGYIGSTPDQVANAEAFGMNQDQAKNLLTKGRRF